MIFRAIFWFSLVVMLLPVKNSQMNADQQPTLTTTESTVSSDETLGLVQAIANDMSEFCGRNPKPCDTAASLAQDYGARVQFHFANLGTYLVSD